MAKPKPAQGRAAGTRQANTPVAPTAVLPIDQIQRSYPGEWVLVRVTDTQAEHGITYGQVLAHSVTRQEVSAALFQAHRLDPTIHTYIGHGGSGLTPTGDGAANLDHFDSWLGVAAFELDGPE